MCQDASSKMLLWLLLLLLLPLLKYQVGFLHCVSECRQLIRIMNDPLGPLYDRFHVARTALFPVSPFRDITAAVFTENINHQLSGDDVTGSSCNIQYTIKML